MVRYAASARDLVPDDAADAELRNTIYERRSQSAALAVGTLIALLLPDVAVALYLAITVAFVVVPLVLARRGAGYSPSS